MRDLRLSLTGSFSRREVTGPIYKITTPWPNSVSLTPETSLDRRAILMNNVGPEQLTFLYKYIYTRAGPGRFGFAMCSLE